MVCVLPHFFAQNIWRFIGNENNLIITSEVFLEPIVILPLLTSGLKKTLHRKIEAYFGSVVSKKNRQTNHTQKDQFRKAKEKFDVFDHLELTLYGKRIGPGTEESSSIRSLFPAEKSFYERGDLSI